jgi:hypothetical protein
MKTATTCSSGDLKVEIEVGHFMLTEDPPTNSTVCDGIRNILSNYRDEYSLRFGRQDLTEIPIRIRATEDLRTLGVESPYAVSGHTYDDAIDLGQSAWDSLPHELNHVRTGPGHSGWCVDYEPWSEAVLGIDQRSYLQCP